MRPLINSLLRLRHAAVTVALLACSVCLAAPKTDVITLNNGDRITGEIKSLDRGKLLLGTDNLGDIEIEWETVASVKTSQVLQVELNSGVVVFGPLLEGAPPGTVLVQGSSSATQLPILNIVRMAPIEKDLIKRFKGSISAGYSLLAANQQEQFNFDFNTDYRTPRFLGKFAANITTNSSATDSTSERALGSLELYHLFNDRWYAGGLLRADRNDELGIKERYSWGAGGGRFLIFTNKLQWNATLGILDTHEIDVDSPEKSRSVEGLISTSLDWFRFRKPEFDLSTVISVLPNLTESGRWRSTYSLAFKWQIYRDFYWKVQFNGDYDNRPRETGAAHSDYSLITSLGSTF
jgi:hypothetical protein